MKEILAYAVTVIICAFTITAGAVYYKTKQIDAMRYNIENAIVKGIDPLAVKCAYGSDDATCIAYALRKSPDAPNYVEKVKK